MPTPWPSPWPKFSPNPACSITPRAAASASFASMPDLAQALHHPDPRDELEASVAQLLVVPVGQVGALEAEPAGQELGHVDDRVASGFDELDVRDGAPRRGVAEISEQADSIRLDDEGDVRADETGQVPHVRRRSDDQRLLELL